MSFTGKATYSAGSALPEVAEDISDLVAINSPFETPLLDALGDAARPARSTVHEWLEDALLPNTDTITDSATFTDPSADTEVPVDHASRFRVGDQIALHGSQEVMLVVAIGADSITVQRGYGGSTAAALTAGGLVDIFGNAALEGDEVSPVRFASRTRQTNYTQIFSAGIEVSGSELAVQQVGISDELDYQKQQRTRELLRDLENCVVNGRNAASTPEGSSSIRRTMRGVIPFMASNRFSPGVNGFPSDTAVTEAQVNLALRQIWKGSNGQVDLIVMGPGQKRSLNQFVATNRRFTVNTESFKDVVNVYESDFGVCRIIMSRWVPPGSILFLDSTRINVMPLAGRSFHYRALAPTGDRESGQVIGEYTLELRNENAHGIISGLSE